MIPTGNKEVLKKFTLYWSKQLCLNKYKFTTTSWKSGGIFRNTVFEIWEKEKNSTNLKFKFSITIRRVVCK